MVLTVVLVKDFFNLFLAMKKRFLPFFLALFSVLFADAQIITSPTKAQVDSLVNYDIPDNFARSITPAKVRNSFLTLSQFAAQKANAVHGHTTTDVSEGSNLYHTTARVQTVGDARYGQLGTVNSWTGANTFSTITATAMGIGRTPNSNAKLDIVGRLNIGTIMNLAAFAPDATVHIGGSGYTLSTAPSFVIENSTTYAGVTPLLQQYVYSDGTNVPELGFTTGSRPGNILIRSFGNSGGGEISLHGSSHLNFLSGNTQYMRLASTGNLLVRTSIDAGYNLDVNGTARVQSHVLGYNFLATGTRTNTINIGMTANDPSYNFSGYGGYWGLRSDTNNNFNFDVYNTASPINAFSVRQNGNFQIGAGTNNLSAILQVDSITKGFLPPRMTSAQRTAISSPATGLIVYQTDGTEGVYIYKSSGWVFAF